MKFDRIKIVTDIRYISHINPNKISKRVLANHIEVWEYKHNSSSDLYISKKRNQNELIIEFTGKILKDKYTSLITTDTIRQCLENINKLGLCVLYIDGILNNSIVVRCDVTADVECEDMKLLTSQIIDNIGNYKRFTWERKSNNLTLTSNVTTRSIWKKLVIYDKYEEMTSEKNRGFLADLSNPQIVKEFFSGKVRFELSLNSKRLIRKYLEIADNRLVSVLSSTATPIKTIMNQIICSERFIQTKTDTLHNFLRWLLIEKCDYDLKLVEKIVREKSSKKSSISQLMKPYRELYQTHRGNRRLLDDILSMDM